MILKRAHTRFQAACLSLPIGGTITRNPGAKWFLPSENEWYKAAYHKNDGVTGNYWNYPTSTDVLPYSDQPPVTSFEFLYQVL